MRAKKEKRKKDDNQLVSLGSNSKMVKVPSNNAAAMCKNMVIISTGPHNSDNYKDHFTCKSQPKVLAG